MQTHTNTHRTTRSVTHPSIGTTRLSRADLNAFMTVGQYRVLFTVSHSKNDRRNHKGPQAKIMQLERKSRTTGVLEINDVLEVDDDGVPRN